MARDRGARGGRDGAPSLDPARLMRRDLLAAVTLVALVLRAYPLHVFYLHPDQEQVPRAAMQMLLAADWRPSHLGNPTALVYTLRLAYTVAYRVGRAFGAFQDKVDLLAAFVERPFPFYLLSRAWSCLTGVVTVVLTTGTARRSVLPLAAALAAGVAVFAMVSPYTFLELSRAWRDVRTQLAVSYWRPQPAEALPFGTVLGVAVGIPMCGLALIGLAAALAECPGDAVALLVPLVPYTASVLLAPRLFARYAVLLVPAIAVFAAGGVWSLFTRMRGWPAHLTSGLLLLVAIADPFSRSVMFDRVLAREDTRWSAGRWILGHVPDGDGLIRPGSGWYSNPELPPTAGDVAFDFGGSWAERLVARGHLRGVRSYHMVDYGLDGNGIDWARPPARWVVTSEHPGLPVFGLVPPEMARFLAAHATPVARFIGYPDDEKGGALFDPIDANFTPLRGFAIVRRPGPNIVVWRLAGGPG